MERVLLSLACLCTALGDSAGQVEGTSDPAFDLKLQEEIQKLGDDEPARRLEARRTIQQMGARTIPGIKRALRDQAVDPEQRAALGEILEEIPRELEFAFEVKSTERCAFSPGGGKLAIYDTEGNLALLDSRTGRQL